jgi:hypothetical protein
MNLLTPWGGPRLRGAWPRGPGPQDTSVPVSRRSQLSKGQGADKEKWEDLGKAPDDYIEVIKHMHYQFLTLTGKIMCSDTNLLAGFSDGNKS